MGEPLARPRAQHAGWAETLRMAPENEQSAARNGQRKRPWSRPEANAKPQHKGRLDARHGTVRARLVQKHGSRNRCLAPWPSAKCPSPPPPRR